jgi:predicted tellurium resistance membrane protein TerC
MNIAQEFYALFSIHGLLALCVLSVLELVLGIDNIIFISLVIIKLPEGKRLSARVIGLSLALVMRIALLFGIVWISTITTILFSVSGFDVSVRDLLFFVGGAYLLWNTSLELIKHINGELDEKKEDTKSVSYKTVIAQIVLVDIIFSFDSIFTAIGLIQNFVIMSAAVACGMVFMLWISGKTSEFINRHPTIKTLALCFIIVVGLLLLSSALHYNMPKGYFYAALGFALAVELLNMRMRKNAGE